MALAYVQYDIVLPVVIEPLGQLSKVRGCSCVELSVASSKCC